MPSIPQAQSTLFTLSRRTQRTSCLGLAGLFLALVVPSAQADDLKADGDPPTIIFRTGDQDGRLYTRLNRGAETSYVFCGQGKLDVLSRALIPDGRSKARYFLDLIVDGAHTAHEFDHVAGIKTGASFEGGFAAGTLKRSSLDLARGCHTVKLRLSRSTVDAVGIRVRFDEKRPTQRPWQDLDVTSSKGTSAQEASEPVDIVVRDQSTAYHRLADAQRLGFEASGPAWIRLRLRPLNLESKTRFAVEVQDKNRVYRSYEVDGSPSRRARLKGERATRVGAASEVVFPVPDGRHSFQITADRDLLARAQVADARSDPFADTRISGWSVQPRLVSYYDSNILRYSDKFVQRFDQGTDPDRFRVESLDDIIHRVDLKAAKSFKGFGDRKAEIVLDLSHRAYQRNSIKDWSRFQLSWNQDLKHSGELSFMVVGMTDFYVRHLRDSDLVGGPATDPFQAFELNKTEATLRYSHPVGVSSRLRYDLSVAEVSHSDAFKEFDSDDLSLAVRLDSNLSRSTRFSLSLEGLESEAQGYDQTGETLATSDDTDPSYRQWSLMTAVRFRLPTDRRQYLFLQAQHAIRDYTTDKPSSVAPLHAGREDTIQRLYASWQIDLTEKYRLTVFAQTRDRSSEAPVQLDIGVEKDYDQYEYGIRLGARFGG